MKFSIAIKIICLLATATMLEGCRKKAVEAPVPSATTPSAAASVESLANNAPATIPPPPAPSQEPAETTAAPVVTNPSGDAVDPNLRAILVKFYNDQAHPAQSWDELLAGKYITKIPIGPDGKPLDWNRTMQAIGRGGR